MKRLQNIIWVFLFLLTAVFGYSQPVLVEYDEILSGANRLEHYLDEIEGKKVALVANQSSLIKDEHLVDTLLSHGVNIVKIFCPEHGFRGNEDAGKSIDDSK